MGINCITNCFLHFDEELINKLKEKDIQFCFITLHEIGTFNPSIKNIFDHGRHSEYGEINQQSNYD